MFTHCSFDLTKNKHDYYRGKDCIKHFCKDLRKNTIEIIDYEMIPLTDEENESYHKQKLCHICKKIFSIDYDDKKYYKDRDHCHYTGKYRGDAHNSCNLRSITTKEIPLVFHSSSKYDYHFIIKDLVKEFEGQNTKKYITFSIPIEKKLIMVK